MDTPICTFIVVPREKFSLAEVSYDDLCAHNSSNYPIIYIDSCSPQPWAGRLDRLAAEGKITLVRSGFYLSQNEAFNLAIPHLKTKYAILMDNDIRFTPGWSESLVACAEETGAWAVMPLIEEKEQGEGWRIHMCGGDCGVEEQGGQLLFREVHHLHGQVQSDFRRCQTGVVEYHSLLVRKEALEKVGPFDEGYWPALDHTDFSLMIRAAGGSLWFEPSSVVKYELPPPLELQDIIFFLTRWNDDLVRVNQAHFAQKWGVGFSRNHRVWYRNFRRRALFPVRDWVKGLFGSTAARLVYRALSPLEAQVSRVIQAWNQVPNRPDRLTALGSWRGPGLDRSRIQAFGERMFRHPRSLQRELVVAEESVARAPDAVLPT